ncbi:MAG: hypothetical protein IH984_07480 [Planctomycetes bacterium]|nr:hypothetical protein [Planctomycetota bacterium]
MNNQKSIPVLLAIIAILLAVNLVMQFEPQAKADTQTNLGPPPVPKVVGGSAVGMNGSSGRIFRFYDDGSVDVRGFVTINDCDYSPFCGGDLIGGCNDLNGDGTVDTVDLLELFADWGECE